MDEAAAIGFLGLGQMGSAMAERLLRSGVLLHVHDPSPPAMRRLEQLGAVTHPDAAAVADAAGTVFACLPNAAVSEAVLTGPGGVLAGRRLATYIEVSTIGSAAAERIGGVLAGREIGFLDAPISGGPPGARAGTLAIMAAGPAAVLDRAMPALRLLGRTVLHVGERPGLGQMMKLVNNLVAAANMATLFEALVLGARAGLDPEQMATVLNAGTGRSMISQEMLPTSVLSGRFDFGATIAVMEKDVSLGLAEAQRLEVPMWTLEQSARLWRFACTQGMAGDDITALIRVMEGWTGASVRGAAAPAPGEP
jgi:3-hydroxyisobutyrate dehydrogenase-like beta-hydroxyacid dehydrogenase